jgi:flagellar biosynthesis/type III secretory pathway protein FliH
MTSKDLQPFLSIVPSPTRPLGAVLPALITPDAVSPWSPRAPADAPAAPSPAEIAAAFELARERGRAEGLAETTSLRGQLAALLAELAAARAAIVPPTAEVISDVATCVIESWIERTERAALFAPIVRGWLARSADQPATVRVHPDDAAALAEVIGDAPLTIAADPALARGALEIRGATLELSHDWSARLADLRTAIIAALTGADA